MGRVWGNLTAEDWEGCGVRGIRRVLSVGDKWEEYGEWECVRIGVKGS